MGRHCFLHQAAVPHVWSSDAARGQGHKVRSCVKRERERERKRERERELCVLIKIKSLKKVTLDYIGYSYDFNVVSTAHGHLKKRLQWTR